MATIALYANRINQMPALIKDVKKSVTDYKSELSALKTKSLKINKSVCNLDDIISSIQTSSQTQEQKIASLETFSNNSEQFITDTAGIDSEVADIVKKRKDDFYDKYYYLKPECEKSGWEKFKDGVKSVGEWCKEHWKLIVTIVLVIAAIVVIIVCPASAVLLLAIAKGILIGAAAGGLLGGLSSLASGGSFWEGFEDGAFTGALTGALFGGIGGVGQMLGAAGKLGTTCKALSVLKHISIISGGISVGMAGFDLLSFGIGLFDPSNPLVQFNQKLHSSTLYNAFQISVSAIAAFSGGAYLGLKSTNPACFVAGTMILTVAGLVAIENIKAGDKVISTNTDTFETAEKTVVETYIREVPQIVHLTINGELIKTTIDHPFYVKNHGFINAGDLQVGDEIINSNGEANSVEKIYLGIAENPVTVYNFQVEDWHTYHVGNIGALVHNADYGKPFTPRQQELIKEGRTIEKTGSISRVKAEDYVNRCVSEGFNKNQVRIDEGHMQRTNPTLPMPGTSGKPHLHAPSGKQHSIPIID